MTAREAKRYESQGWKHQHDFFPENWIPEQKMVELWGIYRLKCRCGAFKIKRGGFEHILE
jgi:hypothetical protein